MAGSHLRCSRELGQLLVTGYLGMHWCLLKNITIFKIEKKFAEIKRILNRKGKQNKFLKTCGHPFKMYFITSLAINQRLNKYKYENRYTDAQRCTVMAYAGNFVLWRMTYWIFQHRSDLWA